VCFEWVVGVVEGFILRVSYLVFFEIAVSFGTFSPKIINNEILALAFKDALHFSSQN